MDDLEYQIARQEALRKLMLSMNRGVGLGLEENQIPKGEVIKDDD